MSNPSPVPPDGGFQPPSGGTPNPRFRAVLPAVLAGYALLCGYLVRPVQRTGDGAVYVLQALEGSVWERTIHVGYLLPLRLWVRELGLPPNAFAVLWAGAALVLVTLLARRILAAEPIDARLPPRRGGALLLLVAPLTLLSAAATWDAALFVEVYGPLGTLLLATALALSADRRALAGLLFAWAALVHPAAWALAPGLLLLSGTPSFRAAAPSLGIAAGLHLLVLALLAPDWWSGGRGLLELPPFDRSPWQSLQAAWRLLARDLSLAALPLIAGVLVAPRRRQVGLVLLVLGGALFLDRFSDNVGQLPALWLACALSPLAIRWVEALDRRRLRVLAGAGGLILLLLGVCEATSRHDAAARSATREATELRSRGCPAGELEDWGMEARWRLLCEGER